MASNKQQPQPLVAADASSPAMESRVDDHPLAAAAADSLQGAAAAAAEDGEAKEQSSSAAADVDPLNWRENPELLVGKRVEVMWAGNKFYAGVVTTFEASTGRHQSVLEESNSKTNLIGT